MMTFALCIVVMFPFVPFAFWAAAKVQAIADQAALYRSGQGAPFPRPIRTTEAAARQRRLRSVNRRAELRQFRASAEAIRFLRQVRAVTARGIAAHESYRPAGWVDPSLTPLGDPLYLDTNGRPAERRAS